MKREEAKINAKGMKSHIPSNRHANYFFKYDRNYVAAHYGDINHVPLSCGSRRVGFFWGYEHPNCRLWAYLNRFMVKQIGRKMDDVFHDFSQLGWKRTTEMYHYWSGFVGSNRCEYYADEDGYMCIKTFPPKKRRFVWDDYEIYDEDDNEPYLLQYAQKPSSQKRLVRRQMRRTILERAC